METKEKECEICGAWFAPNRSNQKYCPECGKDSTRAWRTLNKRMRYSVARAGTGRPVSKTEKECEYCHKTFICYNGITSAYCSKACELADKIQKTKCAYCGKPMLETDDRRDVPSYNWYCSPECREKNMFRIARENGTLKTCPNCGKEFYKNSVYCSNECYLEDRERKKKHTAYLKEKGLKVCAECGKEFSGATKFCSEKCAVSHKAKEPHVYKECVICKKMFLCPASEMTLPLCSDKCSQEYDHRKALKKQQKKMMATEAFKEKKRAAAEEKYVAENGLCSICRTSYKNCERMQSNYTASPEGSVFSGSLVIKCPKYTSRKKKTADSFHRPA